MSFLKKAASFAFGNTGKSYNGNTAALTSQQGVRSDLGSYQVQRNKDGTYTKVFNSSDADKQRNALINQGLGAMSLNPTDVQNAYYDQATRLLNNQFDRERTSTDTNLINRGIQTGTEQYNQVMGDLMDRQNATLQDIANQAVYMGDQNIGQKIGNINSLGTGRDINQLAQINGGSNTAYQDTYNSGIYRDLLRDQRNSNIIQGLFETPATGFKSFTNGFFSDRRLKENLKPVGKLNNGLKVYVGNYKKETGLDTRPQLFLVAQEVKKEHPEAVGKKFGALTVDYKQAVKEK